MKQFIAEFTSVSGVFNDWIYSNVLFWVLIAAGVFFPLEPALHRSGCFRRESGY